MPAAQRLHAPTLRLRGLLWVNVAFFFCMGAAHFTGLKWPVLFVYRDTPFYAYQDKIIAFTLITYIALFFGASQHRVMVPYALISIWGTVLGLAAVNVSPELHEVLDHGTFRYWIITAAFGALAALLSALWWQDRRAA